MDTSIPNSSPTHNKKARNARHYQDLQQECRNHMAENGLAPAASIIADGKIHRYSADGKRDRDEWYVANERSTSSGYPYLNCSYGTWSNGGLKHNYKSFEKNTNFSDAEKKVLREECKKKEQEVERQIKIERDKAAVDADKLWQESSDEPPSDEYLAYVKAKGIKPPPLSIKYDINPQGYPSIIYTHQKH